MNRPPPFPLLTDDFRENRKKNTSSTELSGTRGRISPSLVSPQGFTLGSKLGAGLGPNIQDQVNHEILYKKCHIQDTTHSDD